MLSDFPFSLHDGETPSPPRGGVVAAIMDRLAREFRISIMLACQYKLTGVVKVAAVILAPSVGVGVLLDDCRGRVRVEEKLECRVTYYPQYLDGVASEKAGYGSGGVLGSHILT